MIICTAFARVQSFILNVFLFKHILYDCFRSTHVPVGEDQLQHLQLAQHLAKLFNTRFGETFPIPHALVNSKLVYLM